MAPWVLHVDMDQFIAAVEVLRHPELVGLPVIVGARGDPTERGVVSTASYEARAFGVRSGMPLRTAVRRCPDAVVLPVDKPAYDAASAVVMDTLRAVPGAVVEVLGWDEAFVGVEADDPEAVARRIQADVLAATDLHCSVGIGDTKVRAKIATEFGKPRGTFRLTRDNWFEVMGERPTGDLWGVGSRISQRLAALGVLTVRELAEAEDGVLAAEFGPQTGPWLGALGRGESSSAVDDTPWVPGRTAGRRPTSGTSSRARWRRRCRCSPRRSSTTSGSRAAVRAGAPQGAVPAVLHREPVAQARRADVGCRGDRRHGASTSTGASRTTGRPAARRACRDGAARGWVRATAHPRPPRHALTPIAASGWIRG